MNEPAGPPGSTSPPHLDVSEPPFGTRVGWGSRPALLLVDVVAAYATPGSPLDLGERAAPALAGCAALLEAARAGGADVVHTAVVYAADLADAGAFGRKVPALAVFADGDPRGLGAICPQTAPVGGERVLHKLAASAFAGTDLDAWLRGRGVDTVVVAGFSTSGCVRATATDAIADGFAPMVVGQACGDRTAAYHEHNLADLDAKYADVVTLAEAVAHLSAGAAGAARQDDRRG